MTNATLMICKALGIPTNQVVAVDISLRPNEWPIIKTTTILRSIGADGERVFCDVEQEFELKPKATDAQGEGGQQLGAGG